ncbi:N-acylneuraminate-9-phosphatase isoform X1 [Ascaphus truei]|uniref:N-acylneuraminate-9-phosphatase isoform X1 n=2 Tax=Ascaphus truei TaxID=8439 RepID=UPI003F59B332
MLLHGIKAVFFDLDNTLIDTSGANKKAIDEVMKLLIDKNGYKKEQARIICDKFQAKLLHEALDPSKMTIDDLRVLHWEEAMQEIRPGEYKDVARECYTLWKSRRLHLMTLSESTKDMLIELRKSVLLLLLTNGDRQVQREKIEACGATPFFDAIVVGGEHTEEKPASSIFLHCCNLLGVKPEDCVMVGDNLDTDIQGGVNAGLKATIWINKSAFLPSNPCPVPHCIIHSVLELPGVLKDLQ